jgi:DnaJ-class molecular chaperone
VQPIDGEQEFLCPECALLCAACEGSGKIGEERCKHCFGTGIGTSDDDRDYFGW